MNPHWIHEPMQKKNKNKNNDRKDLNQLTSILEFQNDTIHLFPP